MVEFGCDVNAQDSDGWTPLHCAASCNNLQMVKFLVESGACLFASTLSDHETPAEKCEEDEEGFDGCSEYLYSMYLYTLDSVINCYFPMIHADNVYCCGHQCVQTKWLGGRGRRSHSRSLPFQNKSNSNVKTVFMFSINLFIFIHRHSREIGHYE